MARKIKTSYYGKREVGIRVQVKSTTNRSGDPSWMVTVYGASFNTVSAAIRRALDKTFGHTEMKRSTGRPKTKKRKK